MLTTRDGFSKPRRFRRRSNRGRGRLFLEVLEDRTVPSTLTVTTTTDLAAHSGISLRDAIAAANADANAGVSDTILFDATLSGPITLLQGILELRGHNATTPATITIEGGSNVTVDGGNQSGVFQVDSGVTAALNHLTITHGISDSGGGIANRGTLSLSNSTLTANSANNAGAAVANTGGGNLTVTSCTFSGNAASFTTGALGGGAIYNNLGTVTVSSSTLSSNSANQGGALFNNGGTLTVTGCALLGNSAFTGGGIKNAAPTGSQATLTVSSSTLSGNSAFSGGCGIFNVSNRSSLTATNSTFSGNVSTGSRGGGLLNNLGRVTINNCTLSGNSASGQGGGIYNDTTLTLHSTIAAGNVNGDPVGPDIYSVVSGTSGSYNVIGDGDTLFGIRNGNSNHNQVGNSSALLNPMLSPAANHGGTTDTFALLPGSPALGGGDPGTTLTTDQRGLPRSRGGLVDVGAYQSQGFTLTPLPSASVTTTVNTAFTLGVRVTANDPGLGNLTGGTLSLAVTPAANGASVILGSGTTVPLGTGSDYPLDATANTTAGSYTLTAQSGAGSLTFNLTNNPDVPARVAVLGGDNQSTRINTQFPNPLGVSVQDQFGNPLSGVLVTFNHSGGAADAAFSSDTVTTDANGQGSVTATANAVGGAYTVTASVSGASVATFHLTNIGDGGGGDTRYPATLTVTAGDGQSAAVGTAFASPLVVTVRDQFGQPMDSVSVTFAGSGGSADATLSQGMVVTDHNGRAQVTATANHNPGSYTVTARFSGLLTPAAFHLTNTPARAATIVATSGDGQSALVNSAFQAPLVVTVRDSGGQPVPGVSVTFAGSGGAAGATFSGGGVATTDASGQASVTVTANGVLGGYTVTASVVGVSTPARFHLNNTGQSQTITFSLASSLEYGSSLNLSATGGASGNPVLFRVLSGPGQILNGNVLVATGVGSIVVQATQAGNASWSDAGPVQQTVQSTPAPLIIRADDHSGLAGGTLPALTVSYQGFVNGDTPASLSSPPQPSTSATPSSPPGSYAIVVSGAASPNYTITFVNGTLTLTGNIPTSTTATLSGQVFEDLDDNGRLDPGEPALAGVRVFLDLHGSNRLDPGDPATLTDASGRYSFAGLGTGSYVVRLDPGTPGVFSTTGAVPVSVNGGDVSGKDLGAVLFSPVAPVVVNADLFGGSNPDPNTAFVRGLYHAILGRDANGQIVDGSGHPVPETWYWGNQLRAGLSRTALADQIVNSVEHRGLEVNSYYRTFLHRDLAATPDPFAGYWLNRLLSGVGEATVVQEILDSPEYQAAHADNAVLVRDLYTQALGRAAGDGEVSLWVGMLNAGAKRSAVEQLVLLSQESSQRQVNGFYVAWLHHLPPAGDNLWVDRLSAGAQSAGQVVASILGDPFSQEFYLQGKASVPAAV
jgi:hypothetical protein